MKFKKIVFFALVLFMIPFIDVSASSLSVSSSSKYVTVGSTVTVYIKGNDAIGRVNISSSNASVLSSNTNSVWIEPNGSVSFKAKKVGSATITVSTNSLANGNGADINLGSKSITINVVEKAAPASSNNSLSELTVEGGELTPKFDSNTTEYSVTLKKGTTSVNIAAKAQDDKASINGSGKVNLTEGLNVVNVVVTAANGYTKTYKLNITVEEDPITININKEDYSMVKQKEALPQVSSYYSPKTIKYKYKVEDEEKEFEIPAYYSEVTKYTLVGLKNSQGKINLYIYNEKENSFKLYNEYSFSPVIFYPTIPQKKDMIDNLIETKIKLGENEIDAYTFDKESDYYLLYGVNVETGQEGWFQYDSKDNTIQRYDTTEINGLIEKNNKTMFVVVLLCAVCFLMMFFLLIFISKTIKEKNN